MPAGDLACLRDPAGEQKPIHRAFRSDPVGKRARRQSAIVLRRADEPFLRLVG